MKQSDVYAAYQSFTWRRKSFRIHKKMKKTEKEGKNRRESVTDEVEKEREKEIILEVKKPVK